MAVNNYEYLKKEVYALTKIDLNAYKEAQMKRRIDALIAKHKISGYENFVKALKNDKDLFEAFVNYLTINVSEFYRNPEQWAVLDKDVFPRLINRFGKNLKESNIKRVELNYKSSFKLPPEIDVNGNVSTILW